MTMNSTQNCGVLIAFALLSTFTSVTAGDPSAWSRKDWIRLLSAREHALGTLSAEVTVHKLWNGEFRGNMGKSNEAFARFLANSPTVQRGTWTIHNGKERLDLVDSGGARTTEAFDTLVGTRIVHATRSAFKTEKTPLSDRPLPGFALGAVVNDPVSKFLERATTFSCRLVEKNRFALEATNGPYRVVVSVALWPSFFVQRVSVRTQEPNRLIEEYIMDDPLELSTGVALPQKCTLVLYRAIGTQMRWYERATISLAKVKTEFAMEPSMFRPVAPDDYVVLDERTMVYTNFEKISEIVRESSRRVVLEPAPDKPVRAASPDSDRTPRARRSRTVGKWMILFLLFALGVVPIVLWRKRRT